MVNPCLILGYNLLYKIVSILFIALQEIPRNIELIPFLIIIENVQQQVTERPQV